MNIKYFPLCLFALTVITAPNEVYAVSGKAGRTACAALVGAKPPAKTSGELEDFLIKHVRLGNEGASTVKDATNCSNMDDSIILNGDGLVLDFKDSGLDGKSRFLLSGAVGVTGFIDEATGHTITLYGRINEDSATVVEHNGNQRTYTDTQNEKQQEWGFVYRRPLKLWGDDDLIDSNIYIQPYYLNDEVRKSRLTGVNVRFVPIAENLNHYLINSGPNNEFRGAFIFDVRLNSASFIKTGLPLSVPTSLNPNGIDPNLYLENKDYLRLGVRTGYSLKYKPPWGSGGSKQEKEITASVYYNYVHPIEGVKSNFNLLSTEIDIPLSKNVSIRHTYMKGRTENVAVKTEESKIKLVFKL